jgi:hypothetical protein
MAGAAFMRPDRFLTLTALKRNGAQLIATSPRRVACAWSEPWIDRGYPEMSAMQTATVTASGKSALSFKTASRQRVVAIVR